MQMSKTRRLRAAVGLAVTAVVAAVAVTSAASAPNATTLVIWADADRKAAVDQVAGAWARTKGVEVQVVQKDFGQIRSQLNTVAAETAPDVIVGAHDWIGELSANGSILPLTPSAATKKQFPQYALNSFSYGLAIKKLFGAPVALENIALVTNTKLAKVPTSFADMEKQALAAKKKTKAQVGIAVQQGSGGDAYHMYPFFSGLGGYVFGTNKAGNLDPSDIGVANPKFLKNAPMIDKWNKEGPSARRSPGTPGVTCSRRARSPTTSPARGSSATSARLASSTRSRHSRRSSRASNRCPSSASRASWSRSSPSPTAWRASPRTSSPTT
jgi:maltose-binding protein MalE